MDVSPVLVADLQAPEAVEPGERPFDHPPVAAQAVLGLDTRGRLPLGFGGSGGSSGAIRNHNASGNSSFAMALSSMTPILPPCPLTPRFC